MNQQIEHQSEFLSYGKTMLVRNTGKTFHYYRITSNMNGKRAR